MRRRILVADDEPSILETTRYILESEGFDVLVARNGEEALVGIRAHRPRVVLLDIKMPLCDGIDVCRAVRADPDLAGTYLIVLTALPRPSDEHLARAAGADAYFKKPFDEDQVLALIESAFARG